MKRTQIIHKISLYKIREFIPYIKSKKVLNKMLKKDLERILAIQVLGEVTKLNKDCIIQVSNFV
jgi:hypothetical protein